MLNKQERRVALPCQGSNTVENKLNHIYLIQQRQTEKVIAYATPTQIDSLMKQKKVTIDRETHGICAECISSITGQPIDALSHIPSMHSNIRAYRRFKRFQGKSGR